MTKRIISLLLAVALSLSLIVGGFAPSSVAFADSSSLPSPIVFSDLLSDLESHNTNVTFSDDWKNFVLDLWDDLDYIVIFLVDDSWNFSVTVWHTTYTCTLWYYEISSPYGFKYLDRYNSTQNPSTRNIQFVGSNVRRFSESVTLDVYSGYTWSFSPDFDRASIPSSTARQSLASAFNVSNLNHCFNDGWKMYFNHDIYASGSYSSPAFSANLLKESPVHSFDAVVFEMGSRLYLTTSDFHLLSGMDPEKDDTISAVGWYNYDTDSSDVFTLGYGDLVTVYHPPVSPGTISNIPADGHVYCFDITSWPSGSWLASFSIYYKDDHSLYAEALNLPLDLSLEEQPSVDYYSIANYYYNQYVTQTEDIDPIVLEDLVEELYGVKVFTSGRAYFAPSQVVDQDSDNTSAISSWGFYDTAFSGSDQPSNNSMINYSLLDVAVVIPVGTNHQLKVITPYLRAGTTIEDAVLHHGEFTFGNLIQLCDAVLFLDRLPNDDWPYFMDYTIGSVTTTSDAYLCSYYDQASYSFSTSYSGSCLVLDTGLQKSMLYNFSDGIRKIYDFLQGYVDNHNNWISSQILWQSGLFNELQSIVGKLNSIDNNVGFIASHIQSIVDKLQIIADNTSESEHGFWYLPLFNFINRFKPSDSDFSSAIDAIDTTWEQLSPIPAAPSPPLIPTLYPVNTPALPGG